MHFFFGLKRREQDQENKARNILEIIFALGRLNRNQHRDKIKYFFLDTHACMYMHTHTYVKGHFEE